MYVFRLPHRRPALDYLKQILQQFARLPYENISKIINLNRSADWQTPKIRLPEEVMADHIASKLGGTCFSLTFLLQSILTARGFACYPVMADMKSGVDIHCCLVVAQAGRKYLVDPGYLLTQPMEIAQGVRRIYRTEHVGVELTFDPGAGHYDLFTFNKTLKKWRYRFRDRAVTSNEFLHHWRASFGRNSMHGICLTKILDGGILFVNRGFMREATFGAKKNFNIKRNYHAAIHERFGIDAELVEQAEAALSRNLAKKQALGLWLPKKAYETTTSNFG